MNDETAINERTPPIPMKYLQQLIDTAYELAVLIHYEEVPPLGAEQPLLEVLIRLKQKWSLEPTNYNSYEDPHLLLGDPLPQKTNKER